MNDHHHHHHDLALFDWHQSAIVCIGCQCLSGCFGQVTFAPDHNITLSSLAYHLQRTRRSFSCVVCVTNHFPTPFGMRARETVPPQ